MFDVVLSVSLLAVVLVVAVVKPARVPESLVAAASAFIVVVSGAVEPSAAGDELRSLAPVLVFLAAVLVLGRCCADEGVFDEVGTLLAKGHDGGARLLFWVFVAAAGVTCVLSLDATVVLLTPVVLAATGRLRVPGRPYLYATGHVANSGSLLLPTGNLTNLLALSATGLSLVHFASLMLLPWLLVLAVEYVVMWAVFRDDLGHPAAELTYDQTSTTAKPRFAFAVLGLTLVGFVVTSLVGIEAYWPAVIAAAVLAGHVLVTERAGPLAVLGSIDVPFLVFVAGLAVVVRAATDSGLGDLVERFVPAGESLPTLLLIAVLSAVLANLVNNLPALLIMLPVLSAAGPLAVLAGLIGVNVGPNLSYPGSLATLLWRRVLHAHGLRPSLRRFTILGLLTVPACLLVGTAGLWLSGVLLGT